MTKVDENIQTAQNILSGIVERCYELEEENKKLELQIAELMGERDGKQMKIERLEEENKKLKLDLEQRVTELERLVKELIENKEDKRCIMIDKDGTPIGEEIHDYRSDFIYRM